MKQRMQAMMRYNRLRQETRASNAVLQVKRKHQRREAVDPRADENSLERQQMQDRSYYEYGCVTDGLRADLGLERYREDMANHSASVQESAARPIEEDLEEGEDDDERRREKARRRRKAGMAAADLLPRRHGGPAGPVRVLERPAADRLPALAQAVLRAPAPNFSRFCSGSASVSTQATTAAATVSTRPPSAAARRRSRGSSGRRKPRTTPCRTRPSRPSTSTSAPSPQPRPRS